MDIGAMSSGSSISSITSDTTIIGLEEDDRAFIEISELDKLLGLPPPRFDLGHADIDSMKGLDSADSNHFDPEIDFALPQKPGLPQRMRMEICPHNESEIEVCYNKESANVSVIRTECFIGSDGQEVETECHSYLTEPECVATKGQDEMLYKSVSPSRARSKQWGRGSKTGSLNRVVSKLLAKSESPDDSILQTLLLDPQCLQSTDSICDNPTPKNPPTIPSPVINKLKKLGTSVEVEKPESLLHMTNGQVVLPETVIEPSERPDSNEIPTGYLQIMKSLDKAVGLTSDLTKKKKRKTQKKDSNNQVPSNLQLLAEIENSDNLAKFSFQVDARQVIELPEGQKLFTCDICSGVYHRGFSLKRHYLKTHINYKHISKRDLHNCGILSDPTIEKGGARKKQLIKDDSPPIVTNLFPPSDIPDLYRCHTCYKCFMLISDLKAHLMEHPPVSVHNLSEEQFKNYTCPICKARYQKKKLFLRHTDMCVEQPEVALHYCLYCEKNFPTFALKKQHHLQMHHPKKKLHQCYLCKTKMFKERAGVFKHLVLHHPHEYIGCLSCKLRFGSREEYKKHNKENHKPVPITKNKLLITEKAGEEPRVEERSVEVSPVEECQTTVVDTNGDPNLVFKCTECAKMFASYLNMTRHRRLAHRLIPRKRKKKKVVQKKETSATVKPAENRKTPTPPPVVPAPPPVAPPPPPPDPEVLFYSTVSHNIRENLTHHLDGKLDSQEVMEFDLNKVTTARNKVLNFSASFTSGSATVIQPESVTTPTLQKEIRPTPISPRAPWEKFNFPKNYDGRCGLTSYIKDMSHLDISTQLTMRRNLQRHNSLAGQETNKESPANIPAGLLLVEKPGPDCAETFGDPEVKKDKEGAETVLSGEWVRPRTYLCAVCGYRSMNLWDVEDHKYALHPNVWVPHIEVMGEQTSAWDWFYHRRLPPDMSVEETTPLPPPSPPPCTKCSRKCATTPDLHRHMLDCGGDTTWMTTMLAVTSPGSRRRKWRPFGSRRRKQQGRRGLKRNIPNTPAKHMCGRIRTKPGDMDTIQKMIANLPAKRITRRVIGDDPDIKTRSQATINSVPTTSSSIRSNGTKPGKVGKGASRPGSHKKSKGETSLEDKTKNKENASIKEEPLDDVLIKEEENSENEFESLEVENTIQHDDILTSLQMIPVVRKNPEPVVLENENIIEEPIETSKIIAAMREAMLDSDDKVDNKIVDKPVEKKKKSKNEDKGKPKVEVVHELRKSDPNDDLIICNGCGMQFDNSSACQRHKKKCVYWKEERICEDNKTNKCTHCGSVFPYLMALLKHNCIKVDVSEEPAMPELCPEKPVEEVQGDSVEEIPILSPVGISMDDVAVKRLSHIDSTINEVVSEYFDVSQYHDKYFNQKNTKNISKSPEKSQESQTMSKKCKTVDSSFALEALDRSQSNPPEKTSEKISENHPILIPENRGSLKSSPASESKLMNLPNEVKSPKGKKVVSDIFREVKRRGRKKLKVKVATKVGIRKNNSQNSAFIKKKISKKKRSSNFIMLMKEWEKLEKEGAVAVGKRKRLYSNSEIVFERVHTRRRLNSSISKSDVESCVDTPNTSDTASESVPVKTTRRKSSLGTSPDISPCTSEILSSTSPIKIKKEELNEEIQILPPELTVPKRKPGRPRKKSICETTNQHIKDTINSIIKKTVESLEDEGNKNGMHLLDVKKNLAKQQQKSSSDQPLEKKTEDHIQEAIESIVNENKSQLFDKRKTEDHIDEAIETIVNKNKVSSKDAAKWDKVCEVIYNVSVGNAEIFSEKQSAGCSEDNLDEQNVKKRKQKGKESQKIISVQNSKENRDDKSSSVNVEGTTVPSNLGKNKHFEDLTEKVNKAISNIEKLTISPKTKEKTQIDKISEVSCAKTSPMKNKRKSNFPDEESNVNSKPKERKTKQLSISDYWNFTRYPKKTTDSSTCTEKEVTVLKTNLEEISVNKTVETCNNINDEEVKVSLNPSPPDDSSTSHLYNTTTKEPENMKKSSKMHNCVKKPKGKKYMYTDINPKSPSSTSSKEELALSVIRDKVIKKRKKKLKLKKLLKNKQLEIIDSKVSKLTKVKPPLKDDRHSKAKEKFKKGKKKVKVGVSRNRWEVSIVENKNKPVEIICEEEPTPVETIEVPCNVPSKRFYCSLCDQKFESSFNLYQHQLTQEHKVKSNDGVEHMNNVAQESDPVKYCKSIGSLINDLEKRTLNVAKVMHQLKHRDSTETVSEANQPVVEARGSPIKELIVPEIVPEENWQQEWPIQQEWSSRSTTPLWDQGAQQNWEIDNLGSSSLGSIMDTVNKLLSPDQEVVSSPAVGGYSWSDLQLAMGASDEEMAMLEQLGEHSLQEEYVYDNSRPVGDWPPAEENPTFTDLDNQEQAVLTATETIQDVKKQEPVSDSEIQDTKQCRGVIGRPRRMLVDYESREMVCPTCNKHFLGLPALQTHVAWSHCAPVGNTSRLMAGLKRRALLSSDDVDRSLVCFVCKEIMLSPSQLETHIQAQHTKKADEQEPAKPVLSESAEKLKNKMSLALGGLVDRALNKLLGTNKPPTEPTTSHQASQADLNSGALQLLGRLCAARKRVGSENMKLSSEVMQLLGRLRAVNHKEEVSSRAYSNALANEMRQILRRGKPTGVSKGALQASVNNSNSPSDIKPTNLLDHLAVCSSDVQERPYACPICDLRFLIPSTRNRHIARAHGKYGRKYDEDTEEGHPQEDIETGWKDSMDTGVDANDDGEMLPLCSDCGLSFQSIHEVMQHRIEDHPRRFSADVLEEDSKSNIVINKEPVESSSDTKQSQDIKNDHIKLLPVSDSAIDSTSTTKKKRGRPAKVPDFKTEQNRQLLPESDKHSLLNTKNKGVIGRKKTQCDEPEHDPEISEGDYEDDNEDMDSVCDTSHEDSNTTRSNSPDTHMLLDKLKNNKNRSEENLAELSKLDRRKVRIGNMAEDAVRVKAEAALRELNLSRKNKSSSSAKWGVNAMKFTKQGSTTGLSSSQVNGSPSKTRFASLGEKKWKTPSVTSGELRTPKMESMNIKSDVYDFRDEESEGSKRTFQLYKEAIPTEGESSESNKIVQSINSNVTGSPRKTSHNSKLSLDNS